MKKLLSVIAAILMLGISAWADEAVFDFNANALSMFPGITEASTSSSNGGDFTEPKSTVVNGVTLTVSPSAANTANRIWNDYNLGLQLRVYGGTFCISAPEGRVVTSINFNTSTWNAPTADSGSVTTNHWGGSASTVTFTVNGQIRMNSITVIFGEGSTVTPDPELPQIDSLQFIANLDDNTEFQFAKEVFVNYQNGKYLYLQQADADGYCYVGLIYGATGKTYEMGDIIPAGWKGKKTTYRGLVEVSNVKGLQDAVGQMDEDWYTPFDYTGYMAYVDADLMNYKIKFDGVRVNEVNGKNFTVTEIADDGYDLTLAGYNQFGIDLPEEDGLFTVEAMVSVFNDDVQLYPISITAQDNSTPMWKVWYMGEDGNEYTISDDLYVDYVDKDGLIYVTDNATTILFDLYADWGYTWEEEWSPDWMAIDCGDNAELAQVIKGMSVIKGGTLKATLQDNYTNPRLVVTEAPEAGEGVKPDIVYRDVALTDTLNANGREILYVLGKYNNGKLEGDIVTDGGITLQSIDFYDETGDENVIPNGAEVYAKAYIIQKEAWEEAAQEIPSKVAPSTRKYVGRPAKASVKKSAAKMPINDPAWYTNYEIHAFELDFEKTAVDDMNVTKAVKCVRYVDAMGCVSPVPYDGMNIVITTFSDGSSIVTKVIR